jgi:hypothetical protein
MSYVIERSDIEGRLSTGWNTTAIAWDNTPFVPTPGTAWIRCTILPGNVEALEFGRDTLKEHSGLIDIGIFVPRDTGSAVARSYADTLSTLFDMVEFGTIDCAEASVQNLGADEAWYHLSVTIPYKRREV